MTANELVRTIESILSERNIKKSDFYKETGISSASFSQWRNNIGFPQRKSLDRINAFLGTNFSVVDTDNEKPATQPDSGISVAKQEAIQQIMQASDIEAQMLMDVLKAWRERENPANQGGAGDKN